MSVRQDFSKFSEEITADHARWRFIAVTDIEEVGGSRKVMEDRLQICK